MTYAVRLYLPGQLPAKHRYNVLKPLNIIRSEDLSEEEPKGILERDVHIATTKEGTGDVEEVRNRTSAVPERHREGLFRGRREEP